MTDMVRNVPAYDPSLAGYGEALRLAGSYTAYHINEDGSERWRTNGSTVASYDKTFAHHFEYLRGLGIPELSNVHSIRDLIGSDEPPVVVDLMSPTNTL